jgi:hypothetical protein
MATRQVGHPAKGARGGRYKGNDKDKDPTLTKTRMGHPERLNSKEKSRPA